MAPENENLYLGCEKNQNMTLVRMSSVQYPVPQALFIVTQEWYWKQAMNDYVYFFNQVIASL